MAQFRFRSNFHIAAIAFVTIALFVGGTGRGLVPLSVPTASAARSVDIRAVTHHTIKVRGIDIHYREAGPTSAPVLLLLHGFPSSSHMFRDLMPLLADKYRVIAPDYPGFGYSGEPSLADFDYSFAGLATVIDEFTQKVGATEYYLFMQDYGGPIGFRLAVAHPERVRGIIIPNAIVNVEGWNPDIVKQFAPFLSAGQSRKSAASPSSSRKGASGAPTSSPGHSGGALTKPKHAALISNEKCNCNANQLGK
ncbi:MAG: alpha/beta fold hydrolase [Aestuariivirga sp.]